ncbi:hypothetical protein [Klebsiella quasipneumoniae]|uniref:hypothetical protein n=1 Tax=Klebsiella quasipneumoniae TaxID=1463165 RepID=UPI001D10BCBF|nr:hypothetical protein [Klebsiella quasipneumoniae]
MEVIYFSATLLIVLILVSYIIARKESSKNHQRMQISLREMNEKIDRLKEENKLLKGDIKKLTSDNYNLSNAMSKWEITSYEKMTDMIFYSYMATKSPETSGEKIIAAIERRTNGPSLDVSTADSPDSP